MSNIMQNLVSDSLIIPALENGDRLTRKEFERRYTNMPDLKKAELIEGIVYMGSPLRFTQHGEPHSHIMTWLTNYKTFTPNLRTGDNVTVRLDSDNELQPDALLRIEKGGQSIELIWDLCKEKDRIVKRTREKKRVNVKLWHIQQI